MYKSEGKILGIVILIVVVLFLTYMAYNIINGVTISNIAFIEGLINYKNTHNLCREQIYFCYRWSIN